MVRTWDLMFADSRRLRVHDAGGLQAQGGLAVLCYVSFAAQWGSDAARIGEPVVLVQGGRDPVVPPAHADGLPRTIASSGLWLRPRVGHASVLDASPVAMDWLRSRIGAS